MRSATLTNHGCLCVPGAAAAPRRAAKLQPPLASASDPLPALQMHTWLSCRSASRATCSASCCACGAGSTASCRRCAACPAPPAPTRLAAWVTRRSRATWSTACACAAEAASGPSPRCARWRGCVGGCARACGLGWAAALQFSCLRVESRPLCSHRAAPHAVARAHRLAGRVRGGLGLGLDQAATQLARRRSRSPVLLFSVPRASCTESP